MPHAFFATCPKGTAELLAVELEACGAQEIALRAGGVAFSGELEVAYRMLWWSRIANRVLLILGRFAAPNADALHAGVSGIDWTRHLRVEGTLAVDAVSSRSQLTHTRFIAQRVKDAVVDQLRTPEGRRPGVDTERPDLRLNLYLDRDEAQLALDLAGESLHRRHYRQQQGAAPLKENLAAAVLLRAGWPAIAARGGPLLDPMCGSGTLLIEAALMAGDVAPGLGRDAPACVRWPGHDAPLWERLREEAAERREVGSTRLPKIRGCDLDPHMVAIARDNIRAAGCAGSIVVESLRMDAVTPEADDPPGLVVCNPPWGTRLGDSAQAAQLYRSLGITLRERLVGWDAAILIGEAGLGNAFGIRAHRINALFNGALECTLLRFKLVPANFRIEAPPGSARVVRAQARAAQREPSAGALMFANRLRRNLRTVGRWARRTGTRCYRLYDADMPEYALAIDLYQAADLWVHVQEYVAPATVAPEAARLRLDEALAQLPALLEVPPERIVLKRRERQRGVAQYGKVAVLGQYIEVEEAGLRFRVNLRDYLDTGLFLDHRLTRALIRARAAGREVLNLFAYTGSASVYAAAGGATHTTSVDLSATYCAWARQNLALNGYGLPHHEVIEADCLTWLGARPVPRYGLIFLDPPTFSNSKRMQGVLDVQRDHVRLIRDCLRWLAPGGTLLFSTNHRRFELARDSLADLTIVDRSRDTLPEDFRRNTRIHQCYEISA